MVYEAEQTYSATSYGYEEQTYTTAANAHDAERKYSVTAYGYDEQTYILLLFTMLSRHIQPLPMTIMNKHTNIKFTYTMNTQTAAVYFDMLKGHVTFI